MENIYTEQLEELGQNLIFDTALFFLPKAITEESLKRNGSKIILYQLTSKFHAIKVITTLHHFFSL